MTANGIYYLCGGDTTVYRMNGKMGGESQKGREGHLCKTITMLEKGDQIPHSEELGYLLLFTSKI